MTDIKELALRVANETDSLNPRIDSQDRDIEFAIRLIAAYMEGQVLIFKGVDTDWLASVLHFANKNPDYFPDIADGKYSLDSSDATIISRLFTAPPEPAPQQQKPQTTIGDSASPAQPAAACAAPSSEEVREMVERLRSYSICTVSNNEAADLIEHLAARVPDGCVVVPREPTDAMIGNEWNRDMLTGIWKAMIAAGEVK